MLQFVIVDDTTTKPFSWDVWWFMFGPYSRGQIRKMESAFAEIVKIKLDRCWMWIKEH